jgi:hypothetical protein
MIELVGDSNTDLIKQKFILRRMFLGMVVVIV